MPSKQKIAQLKEKAKRKKFILFTIGFNVVGIANLATGTISINGSIPVAEAVLTSSLACLVTSLVYPTKELKQMKEKEEKRVSA